MDYSLEEAALVYAARGWAVLPLHVPVQGRCSCGQDCGSEGKHPRTLHGLKDATIDVATIRAWWRRWPGANVGIATGKQSDLVVLDVDLRPGGEEALAQLEAYYESLPSTLVSHTGGGGRHLLFRHPRNHISNMARLGGLNGLDVRGDGGYIVGPPSRHSSGHRYTWLNWDAPLAKVPSWLYPLLTYEQGTVSSSSHHESHLMPPTKAGQYWLNKALELAHPGNRNEIGFWLACKLRDAGLSQQAAESFLLKYAAQVPAGDHPYRTREVLASLRSAYLRPARELVHYI